MDHNFSVNDDKDTTKKPFKMQFSLNWPILVYSATLLCEKVCTLPLLAYIFLQSRQTAMVKSRLPFTAESSAYFYQNQKHPIL